MKVASKLALGFGLLVLAMAAVLTLHFSTMRGMVATNADLSAIAGRLAFSASEPPRHLESMQEMARKYEVTGDLRYAGKFEEARDGFESSLRELASFPLEPGEREAVERLRATWDAVRPRFASLDEAAAGAAGAEAAVELDSLLAELGVGARRLSLASQEAMVAGIEGAAAAARRTERISWAAVAGALVLGLVVSIFIIRSISDPLARLAAGTRAVAEGNFAYRLDAPRDDEFSRLAAAFNRMTERLEDLERTKQDFLSQISHDLKTPLAGMREAGALLLEEIPGPLNEKQRRLLELGQRSGERLSSMISQLLDLSRMEAGAMEYEFRREDLATLVQGVVEEFETRLPERGLRMEVDLPDRPLVLECDANRMGQVVGNVLENAVAFSPGGGTIRLSLRRETSTPPGAPALPRRRVDGVAPGGPEAGLALLEVEDEGPGVPEGEREAIFEKFHRLEAGRRVARGGVGLGLAVCREILGAHGGTIWAAGVEGRSGAAFRILLPGAAVGEPRARATEPRSRAATSLAGLLLLVLLSAGCATSRFDRLYEEGRYEEAVATYETDLDLQRQESALWRAALMRARPGSPVYDPERALREFARLLDRHPDTRHRESALAQMTLLEEVVRLRRERTERAAVLDRMEEELAALRRRSDRLADEVTERDERIERLQLLVDALRDDLVERGRRLAGLEEELERLKAIDLSPS